MKLPLIVMLPSIKEKIDIVLDPLKFKSTKAISADAPPPSPLKRATNSGISVILINLASIAPTKNPPKTTNQNNKLLNSIFV